MDARAWLVIALLAAPLAIQGPAQAGPGQAGPDQAGPDQAGLDQAGPGQDPTSGQAAMASHAQADPAAEAGVWIWHDSSGRLGPADVTPLMDVPFHVYPHLDMVAFEGPRQVADRIAALGGTVSPNERADLHLDETVSYIEADRVRSTVGNVRDGPTVVVVDTGVDSLHPDFVPGENLAANVQADRTGGLVTGVQQTGPVLDRAGHGTHVAGIVAGLGKGLGDRDPNNGRYEGVYSNGRVAGFQAATSGEDDIKVDTVAALEAFDWALANRAEYDIRVVTNSWGVPGDLSDDHPVNQATLRLYLNGMTVVFSAGNAGGIGTLNKYCQPPWVLCVAAGDLAGGRASFSSRGSIDGAVYDHPDITAPGYNVDAPEPPARADVVGGVLSGDAAGSIYGVRSGTSMAAPHVAGTAALILAANPDLSPDQVMDVLVASADPMLEAVHEAGGGYLNARGAYNLAVQTQGNLDAFLDGSAVKYAGPQSGDPDYARDAVTVGYDGAFQPGQLLAPAASTPWMQSQPIIFGTLLGLVVISLLAGIRFRA